MRHMTYKRLKRVVEEYSIYTGRRLGIRHCDISLAVYDVDTGEIVRETTCKQALSYELDYLMALMDAAKRPPEKTIEDILGDFLGEE